MLGEGDADHVHHADNGAHGDHQQHQQLNVAATDDRALVMLFMGMHRRLRAALQDECGDADGQRQQGRQRTGLGECHHAQPHRQWWPDNEADFVQHRLQGVGGLQLGAAAIHLSPACPHHRRHARHATGQRGEEKQRPVRRLQPRAQQQQQQCPTAQQRRYR
ncbi:hypothetical protein D3C80_1233510 [compost metagenome]